MRQHTPGPWHVNELGNVADKTRIVIGVIATTFESYSGEANARLIAAAPDLLEALEWCADTLAVFVDDGSAAPDSVVGKNLTTARAAIARAEAA